MCYNQNTKQFHVHVKISQILNFTNLPCAHFNSCSVHHQTPGPGDPFVDSYTVSISTTDGQKLCGNQTTGGMVTSVVLDVTGCVMCQGSNKTYAIAVQASNRDGQTTSTTLLCKATSNL